MPLTWKDSGLRWYWVVVLVFLADQLSKQWVLANFDLFESVQLLPFFNFTYVRNYGAAFSFLSEAGGWQRWLFTIVAVGFSSLLTVWLRKQSASLLKLNLAYTLVIGGALGNLVDRLMHGFVVDFIDFYWGKSHYPAFNIADSAIFIGAVLIIWDSFFNSQSEQDKTEEVK
ncbi:signal peptidase II [Shewanella oneidensis MR-1]|uniref:Lipoprotein signal peptidase n=1 Tax=Shewanella oneidensis (strain ATCC 700550 / JCM 31522 / CIP 106686 / LMG 19005 / NCIMB 14063 / MR-1) TaxID=211586 RepID=LSPA_SHEON|nr:signal peptidase II [Shewanella oneidensis]Q8EBI5.1 RecName: Full=Lipoprotein signal peptidase; AltName: Full=Prolipoprotein signal peptidase; AltName: Full=Signal peptidase II; Short=SPase II [Shewanella oneidensis MR-1]AAN56522.1 signal peptidase II LspA [Shewanella oneidensis MR-1]MDX5999074.1 signal peptidase II [Shewanella oneidensis]MEE2029595.1 Lipoprotein signal peptidase [Shewanella oneidensis]QKG97901.1 signal peptidase II [Shewanella oneidensis MR-1]